jgi:hypothetical protein
MKTALSLLSVLLLAPLGTARAQVEQFDGRPVFAEDTELSYYIWRDTGENADQWHLRWTTKGLMRRFGGSVTAEGGKLKSLKRVDVETEHRVLYPGRPARVWVGPRGRTHVAPGHGPGVVSKDQDKIEKDGDNAIVFFTRTDDVDGFDFKVDDKVDVLRFQLAIEGSPRPLLVETGRENRKPGKLPLVVRIR